MLKSPLHSLALILPLLVPYAVWAEVKIPAACRVKNRPPGRCGWCALETLARHLGLQAMYGLTEKHPSLCSPQSLEECLTNAGISYRIQYPGRRREDILRYAIRAELGAAVGLREPYPGADKHIVTLVDFGDDAVKVIDSDDAECRTRQMSMDRFLRWWDGFALVLEPASGWVQRSERRDEHDAARRPVYGAFTPPVGPLCPSKARFQDALVSRVPKMERGGSTSDPWRRSRRAWALRTPFCKTFWRIPTTMRRA
jgi:hypothetical protein